MPDIRPFQYSTALLLILDAPFIGLDSAIGPSFLFWGWLPPSVWGNLLNGRDLVCHRTWSAMQSLPTYFVARYTLFIERRSLLMARLLLQAPGLFCIFSNSMIWIIHRDVLHLRHGRYSLLDPSWRGRVLFYSRILTEIRSYKQIESFHSFLQSQPPSTSAIGGGNLF